MLGASNGHAPTHDYTRGTSRNSGLQVCRCTAIVQRDIDLHTTGNAAGNTAVTNTRAQSLRLVETRRGVLEDSSTQQVCWAVPRLSPS